MKEAPSIQSRRLDLTTVLPADCAERRPLGEAKSLMLLLHGYEQDGKGLLERCEQALPADAHAIAPNGLFPLPRKVDRSYRIGFSWYFYDPRSDQYVIEPRYGVAFLKSLLSQVNPGRLPVTIVGFSQGGYLAPFVAAEVPEVSRIVGMGCQFLDDEIDVARLVSRGVRMDAIHGANDEVVSPEAARNSHEALKGAGIAGDFILLAETGHRIDAAMRGCLDKLLTPAP